MPYQSVFGNSNNSSGAGQTNGSSYQSVFGNNTTWTNNQPSAQPAKPTPQPTFVQQAGSTLGSIFNTVSNDIKNPGNIASQIDNFISQAGNYIKTNILDNPTVKNVEKAAGSIKDAVTSSPAGKQVGNFFNAQGTAPLKGTTMGSGYTFTGDTPKDIANVLLSDILPGLIGAQGSEAAQGFSKSRAVIGAALQAGVQIAAGAKPSEVIKNLPFGLASGIKGEDILPKIEAIKDTNLKKAVDSFPKVVSPDEIKSEVVGSNLANTPAGKEILKTAFQADNQSKDLLISHDPTSNLQTPAGIGIKVDLIDHGQPPPKVVYSGRPVGDTGGTSGASFFTDNKDLAGKYADLNKNITGQSEVVSKDIGGLNLKEVPKKEMLDAVDNAQFRKTYDGIKFMDEQGNANYALFNKPGEGPKPSKLGLRVEQTAIEKKLTTELQDLPSYEQMNMKEQSQKATDLIKSDPQRAMNIALGKEDAPAGLQKESVFKAVEASITTPEQAVELAHSPLVTEATTLGQRIKALDVKTSESPVEAIKQIINAREKAVKDTTGRTVNQATTDTIKDIKDHIEKATPSKSDWASFVKGIQC